jgi:biotin carboxyl carrier protein
MINYQRLREGTPDQLAAEPASLSASIPAVVSELLVQVGDRVETGDKLILLESMKMILPVQAPFEGIVSAINCSVGEAVQPGIQLIEIEQ